MSCLLPEWTSAFRVGFCKTVGSGAGRYAIWVTAGASARCACIVFAMTGDDLLQPAQRQAWARARIHMNLGQVDQALDQLALAVDWECDLYEPNMAYDGWEAHETDLMPQGWLYLDPRTDPDDDGGMALGHPETVDLALSGSGMLDLVDSFSRDRRTLLLVDTDRAIEWHLQDLLYQQTLPDIIDLD